MIRFVSAWYCVAAVALVELAVWLWLFKGWLWVYHTLYNLISGSLYG